MCIEEQKVFESLLTTCKLSFTVEDGLYMISKGNQVPVMIQTQGFNLLSCTKRLMDSRIVENLLH